MLSKNKYCFRVATILVILTILQWVITYMEAYQEATPLNQFYFTTSFPRSIWFEMLLMLLFPYVILMDYHKAVSSGYIHQMMIRVGIKQMFFYSIKQITKYTLIFSILLYAVVLFNSYVIAFIQPNGIIWTRAFILFSGNIWYSGFSHLFYYDCYRNMHIFYFHVFSLLCHTQSISICFLYASTVIYWYIFHIQFLTPISVTILMVCSKFGDYGYAILHIADCFICAG